MCLTNAFRSSARIRSLPWSFNGFSSFDDFHSFAGKWVKHVLAYILYKCYAIGPDSEELDRGRLQYQPITLHRWGWKLNSSFWKKNVVEGVALTWRQSGWAGVDIGRISDVRKAWRITLCVNVLQPSWVPLGILPLCCFNIKCCFIENWVAIAQLFEHLTRRN